jgi:hypothetical protein
MSIEEDTGAAGTNNFAFLKDVAASIAGSAACTYTGQPFGETNICMLPFPFPPGHIFTSFDLCRYSESSHAGL